MVNKTRIASPLLWRLCDLEPDKQFESMAHKFITEKELYEQIRINLENILNTRKHHLQWPEQFKEINNSVLNYGIEDFMNSHFGSEQAQLTLVNDIKATISHFEKRLKNLVVIILPGETDIKRELKIRIEADIDIKPDPVTTIFESCLDVANQTFAFE